MFQILRRFIPPYRSYVVLNVLFNILATVMSLFSFATIIPVLRLLFGLTELNAHYTELVSTMPLKDYLEAARGNMY
ncbi:MAG: ABC transporter ATP-binding protein, partial [Paludibacteraceae bacterium]|nr:ABC transporter ATP-binding protein [Paludibacteraceae bacterium]